MDTEPFWRHLTEFFVIYVFRQRSTSTIANLVFILLFNSDVLNTTINHRIIYH